MLILDQRPVAAAEAAMFRYGVRPKRWLMNPVLADELRVRLKLPSAPCWQPQEFLEIPVHLDWDEPFEQQTMEKVLLRSAWDEL